MLSWSGSHLLCPHFLLYSLVLSPGRLETSEFAARAFHPLDGGWRVHTLSPCTYVRWLMVVVEPNICPLCYGGLSTFTPCVSLNRRTIFRNFVLSILVHG